ncbi:DUF779 domain-containing protein [Curvibacter sp. CHRR-16]|uniref:DUF779 domain-containing protein n=1 Tax=Curvibacter sp. CHRR-16 TaxID=2835872 RepID=UPI001BD91B6A|nr:DUF779 domain-containing protein [Curvibacter sp. CHRR-16]MBT0570557.1 DUF779 domain-containing protein [Curvibacter sp. CHRR-16]
MDTPASQAEAKVVATPAALALVAQLQAQHGPQLLFYQSGGCCENSAACCYLPGEIPLGNNDVLLGEVGGCPFYMSASQYATWQHTQIIIDAVPGECGTFSLESGTGQSFFMRSRVFGL